MSARCRLTAPQRAVLVLLFVASASTVSAQETWEVTASWLNVRRSPDLGAAVIGGLPEGTRVRPTAASGLWRRVTYSGGRGWVHGRFLRPVEPAVAESSSLHGRLLARARAERANASHLLLLDRGLSSSPLAGQVEAFPERLAAEWPSASSRQAPPFPGQGQRPRVNERALSFLHPWIKQACVVVLEDATPGLGARWYGRRPFELEQCWSATKHLQAINMIVQASEQHPGFALEGSRVREAGSTGGGFGMSSLLRSIVSYEDGVTRSNAGAATLGRLVRTEEREELLGDDAGLPLRFRGRYGARDLVRRPELVAADGSVLLRGPLHAGPSGPNLVSTYHLLRPLAQAAWHPHLSPEQRLPHVRWESLRPLLVALGHDSARYVDVGLEALGWDRVGRPVVLSKLGHGYRSATGLPEIAYVAVVQFEDARTGARRAFGISLRAVHRDPVQLDVRVGAEVAELVSRIVSGELED